MKKLVFLATLLSSSLAFADVELRDVAGTRIVDIKDRGNSIESFVTFSDKQLALSASTPDTNKRSYKVNAKEFEVKRSDDGFKLKNSSGKLLWKVKFKEEKIKISDNEENNHPFELKKKSAQKIGVEKEGSDLGAVRFDASTEQLEVETAAGKKIFRGGAKKLSYSAALFLLDAIPVEERGIILIELALRDL